MSKYIPADKLIVEIERLSSSEHPIEYEPIEKLAYNRALLEIEGAITSLQQEQPSNLDEAAQRIAYDVCKQLPNGEEKDGIVYYAILAAIAGAEWMAGQISKAE